MTTISNLHTHCTYCDGNDPMEDMVRAAESAGLRSIGFSSHWRTNYNDDVCQVRDPDGYFRELEDLKKKYAGRILVFKGMELESRILIDGKEVHPTLDSRCDYTIGAVHYYHIDGVHYNVDYTPQVWLDALKAAGSLKKLLENYFEEYLSFAKAVPFDIIAHFDLPTKFNDSDHLFDEDEKWYQDMALGYLDAFAATGKIFEINTGAMSRGYRKSPYPTPFLLKRLLELKSPIILSSDSHSVKTVTHAFPQTEQMLRDMGFREQMRLTENGFVNVCL